LICVLTVVTIAWGSSSLSEESSLELDELPSSDDESDNCSVVVDVGAKLLGADMGAEAGTVAGNEAMTRGDSCGLAFDATAVDTRAGSGEILPLSFGLSLTILFKVVIALFAVGVLTRLSCIVLVTLSRVTSCHENQGSYNAIMSRQKLKQVLYCQWFKQYCNYDSILNKVL
jgi:hypothetical protein